MPGGRDGFYRRFPQPPNLPDNDPIKMKQKPAKPPFSGYKLWLSLLLGVPIAALIAFSALLVSEKRDVLSEMNEIDNASHLINNSSDLVHELQKERGYTSGFIASPKDNFKIQMLRQREAVDRQYALFLKNFSSASRQRLDTPLVNNFNLAVGELGELKKIREGVDAEKVGYFEALDYYSRVNLLLLDATGLFPALTSDREISSLYLAYYHLQQIMEKAGQQRAHLTYAFASGRFLPGQYERFLRLVADESYSEKRFLALASPDIQENYQKVFSLREVAQAEQMRKMAIEKAYQGNFGIDASFWNSEQTIKIDHINEVCDLLEERTAEVVDERLVNAERSLAIYLAVNIAVVAFALAMAVLLFRNMAKRREAEENLALHAKRMENALSRAEDVLDAIATTPDIMPFFNVSPIYRSVRSVGGGDIIKWVRFHSQYAGLYLHDVAGHDIEEILLNILAASMVDICKTNPEKKSASTPSVFLNCLNEHLIKYCEGRPDYLTAIYLLMDFEEHEIKLATGGHPPPWLINPNGAVRPVETPTGFILGQFAITPTTNDRYRDAVLRLENGQLLLVCSDGLMEQKDFTGTTFEAKFTKKIGPRLAGLAPAAAFEIVSKEFEAHLNGLAPEDDVSFVILGTRPADKYKILRFVPGPELLSLITTHREERDYGTANPWQSSAKNSALPSGKAGAAVIHKLSDSYEPVIETLKNAGWTPVRISQVELAVSEMVINAIMHGNMCCDQCTVELSYTLHEDVLELSVADEGVGFDSKSLPQSIEENLMLEGGRGHHMITAMADSLYFNDAGNRCWAIFTKELPSP